MRIHRNRPIVIAEITWIVRGEKRALLDAKALAVGGGHDTFSPDPADGKLMMEVDQRSISGFDGVLAQEPATHVLEHIHGDPLSALAHSGNAEICTVGDQR